MARSDFNNLTPGFPAHKTVKGAIASPASGAALNVPASVFNAKVTPHFTPNQTFNYVVPGGSMTFYNGNPVAIDAGLRAKLIALGLGA